jgi:hypothetical protein
MIPFIEMRRSQRPFDEIRSKCGRGRQLLGWLEPLLISGVVETDLSMWIDGNSDGNGGNHADHSLVAGRSAGRGHRVDVHARHLIRQSSDRKACGCLRNPSAPPKGGVFLWIGRRAAKAIEAVSKKKSTPACGADQMELAGAAGTTRRLAALPG